MNLQILSLFWIYIASCFLFLAILPVFAGSLVKMVGWPQYTFRSCYQDWNKFFRQALRVNLFTWVLYLFFFPATLFYFLLLFIACMLSIKPWR